LPATSVTVTVKWSWTLSSPAVVVGAAGFLVGVRDLAGGSVVAADGQDALVVVMTTGLVRWHR
jgi:hypothetical protein